MQQQQQQQPHCPNKKSSTVLHFFGHWRIISEPVYFQTTTESTYYLYLCKQ
jgi:hypothetical protein